MSAASGSADTTSRGSRSGAVPRALACFTFDNMGEAADIGAGLRTGPRDDGPDPSLARGYPRLLDLLARCDVRATFFVEGWNGDHHADAVAEIVRRDHELGMHGWVHETWHQLDPDEELARATRATDALERAAGVRPRGFRAPGGMCTPATPGLLRRLGYAYDASLGDGMCPRLLPAGIAQIPFVWPGVDGFHYLRPDAARPADVRDLWLRTLAQVAATGGLFVTICHAFITGVDDARLAALEAVMRAACDDPRITVRTAGEIAAELLAEQTESDPTHPRPSR